MTSPALDANETLRQLEMHIGWATGINKEACLAMCKELRTALSNAPEQMDEMDITRAVLNIMRQSDKPETLCRKLVEWLRFHPNGLKITAAPNGGA